jgi:hypothetical protein
MNRFGRRLLTVLAVTILGATGALIAPAPVIAGVGAPTAVDALDQPVEAGGTAADTQQLANDPREVEVWNHTGTCVTDPNGSLTRGQQIEGFICVGDSYQKWNFDYVGSNNGYPLYMIRNVRSGLCLNVSGASTTNSASVIQWTCQSSAHNTVWRGASDTSGRHPGAHYFINLHSGKCLNLAGYNLTNGAWFVQWTCNASYGNEAFTLNPA